MATSATKEAVKAEVKSNNKIDLDTVGLLQLICEMRVRVLNHPHVKNKTETGVASKIARAINAGGAFEAPVGESYWTGAAVTAFEAKHAKK